MSAGKSKEEYIVIGAGPVGLLCAISLVKQKTTEHVDVKVR